MIFPTKNNDHVILWKNQFINGLNEFNVKIPCSKIEQGIKTKNKLKQ